MTELFKENRTLLVIAHRLQVSEIADRVIVLKMGLYRKQVLLPT